MTNPIFGADSMFDDSGVVLSITDGASPVADDPLFPRANLNNDRVSSAYKNGTAEQTLAVILDAGVGNTRKVDYFMLVGHDLFDPAQDGLGPITNLKFQHSADGIIWSDVFTITPGSTPTASIADNRIIARSFKSTPITRRFFRMLIDRPGDAFIATLGELQWGESVEIPTGVTPGFDPNVESSQVRRTQSQTGNILGTTERYADRIADISIPLLDNSFIDDDTPGGFRNFWDKHAIKMKPFLWHWNPDSDVFANPGDFEKDAFFAIIQPDTTIQRPLRTQLAVGLRDLSFTVTGLKEEE